MMTALMKAEGFRGTMSAKGGVPPCQSELQKNFKQDGLSIVFKPLSDCCHFIITICNGFNQDLMFQMDTKWCFKVKWKEHDAWFLKKSLEIKNLKPGVLLRPPLSLRGALDTKEQSSPLREMLQRSLEQGQVMYQRLPEIPFTKWMSAQTDLFSKGH